MKITTYYPEHTLVETGYFLPKGLGIFLSDYGVGTIYTLATVDGERNLVEVLNYSPCGIDMAYKNLIDWYVENPEARSKEILTVHKIEGIHEDYVFQRVRYYHINNLPYDQIQVGNSGEIGLRGGLSLDLALHHDPEPFIKILWDLYKLHNPHYENPRRLTEIYEKYVVRSKR